MKVMKMIDMTLIKLFKKAVDKSDELDYIKSQHEFWVDRGNKEYTNIYLERYKLALYNYDVIVHTIANYLLVKAINISYGKFGSEA